MRREPKPQDLAERIFEVLRGLVPARSALVVGVSGGADSVALLHAICRVWPEASRRVLAVHVNHGLRGRAAQSDQRLVEALCRRLEVGCRVYAPDVRTYARQQRLSLEEAGRKLRQESFLEAARAFRARAVVMAHHRDDQVETLLLNLLRGAATKGLGGMLPARAFPHPQAPRGLLLLRPCLSLPKHALQAYAQQHRLPWREDASNRDPRFTRNRLRKKLLPLLEKQFNPEVRSVLARTADCAARDEMFLDALAERAAKTAGWKLLGDSGRLDFKKFQRLDPALRFRVLSRIWDRLQIPDKTHRHLTLMASCLDGSGGSLDLPGGWRVFLTPVRMELRQVRGGRPEAALPSSNSKPAGGVQSQTCPVPTARDMPKPGSAFVFMDAGKVTEPLQVRPRRPGDRMRPLGLGGKSREVKKILTDMKVPLAQREDWPMVVMGREIVWVYLGPVSETVKLEASSRRAIRVCLSQMARATAALSGSTGRQHGGKTAAYGNFHPAACNKRIKK